VVEDGMGDVEIGERQRPIWKERKRRKEKGSGVNNYSTIFAFDQFS
jgi:hypothetical protein